jgi:GntR family transcriptional regulator
MKAVARPGRPGGNKVVRLRRDSPIAMHRQLAEQLRRAIRQGAYKQGERIPTESELAKRYEVSRITARQAVMQLVRDGLVVRRQGKGTFVSAANVNHDLASLRGIYAGLVAQGVNPTTQILEFGETRPPARVAERLRSGELALPSWKRLYLRDGAPFAVAWVYLAPSLPRIEREVVARQPSYEIFEQIMGLKIDHADISIRAQASTAELRRLLHLPPSTPTIALERVSFLGDGTPIEYTLYCAHADAYEFSFKVRDKVHISSVLTERREPANDRRPA